MLDKHEQSLKKCFQAFINRDYVSCAKQALSLLPTNREYNLELMQVILISYRRLGMAGDLERLWFKFQELLKLEVETILTGGISWKGVLLKTCFLQVDLSVLLHMARNDRQRCQAYYYSGIWQLLIAHREEVARKCFEACLEINAPCWETEFARVELAGVLSDSLENA